MRIHLLPILLSLSLLPAEAAAIEDVTHTGQLDLELHQTDEKGRSKRVSTLDGKLAIAWESRECELTTRKATYPCKLDNSQDLLSPTGELWIKELPKVRFEPKVADSLLLAAGVSEGAVRESASRRPEGVVVPWYTHQEPAAGSQPGQPPKFWSAFGGMYVDLPLSAPGALNSEKRPLKMRIHFHGLKARRGAFNITGNNESGNFGD